MKLWIVAAEHSGATGIPLGPFTIPSAITSTWLIIAVLAVVSLLLTHNLKIRPTSRRQVVAEMIVTGLLGLVESTVDTPQQARRLLPVLGSFFILILTANYSGLIPGFGVLPGLQAPTSVLSVTAGLGICSFVYMLYLGIHAKGFGYFKHWVQPFAVMLPLNILDEVVKPLSLALRLFGSVYAEEIMIISIAQLIPVGVPVPFYFISLFFGALQALIFTMLSATYFNMAESHAEHSETPADAAPDLSTSH